MPKEKVSLAEARLFIESRQQIVSNLQPNYERLYSFTQRPFSRSMRTIFGPDAVNNASAIDDRLRRESACEHLNVPEITRLLRNSKLWAMPHMSRLLRDFEKRKSDRYSNRFNTRFLNVRDDTTALFMAEMLNNPKTERLLLKAVDDFARRSTKENLEKIDSSEKKVRKNAVIIGDGPIALLIAQILSPFLNVTILTKSTKLAERWRSRQLYVNSSVSDENTVFDLPLPTLSGITTPLAPFGNITELALGDFLKYRDLLKVKCDNNETRTYVPGPLVGRTVAVGLKKHCSDVILGQDVAIDELNFSDGDFNIPFYDLETGEKREIDAKFVFLATGPGNVKQEFPSIQFSNEGYISILLAKRKKALVTEQYQSLLANKFLNLEAIELLFSFWEDVPPKKRTLENYPFRELFQIGSSVIIIGSNDTALTLAEFLDKLGPIMAYTNNDELVQPKITIISPLFTKEELIASLRNRYKRDFDNIEVIKGRAVDVIIDSNDRGCTTILKETGSDRETSLFSTHVINATGLKPPAISKVLQKIPIKTIPFADGEVGQESENKRLQVVGSVNSGEVNLLNDFKEIIATLGINENTIALWLWYINAQYQLYRFLREQGADVNMIRKRLKLPKTDPTLFPEKTFTPENTTRRFFDDPFGLGGGTGGG